MELGKEKHLFPASGGESWCGKQYGHSSNAGNRSPIKSSYTTLRPILKGLYSLLQRHLAIRVQFCSIHSSQELETAWMSVS